MDINSKTFVGYKEAGAFLFFFYRQMVSLSIRLVSELFLATKWLLPCL